MEHAIRKRLGVAPWGRKCRNKEVTMYVLCEYVCSYCGRAIETSFVTLGEKHYHALENEKGEKASSSCYDLARQQRISFSIPTTPSLLEARTSL
jgi:hypothetical protein